MRAIWQIVSQVWSKVCGRGLDPWWNSLLLGVTFRSCHRCSRCHTVGGGWEAQRPEGPQLEQIWLYLFIYYKLTQLDGVLQLRGSKASTALTLLRWSGTWPALPQSCACVGFPISIQSSVSFKYLPWTLCIPSLPRKIALFLKVKV